MAHGNLRISPRAGEWYSHGQKTPWFYRCVVVLVVVVVFTLKNVPVSHSVPSNVRTLVLVQMTRTLSVFTSQLPHQKLRSVSLAPLRRVHGFHRVHFIHSYKKTFSKKCHVPGSPKAVLIALHAAISPAANTYCLL